jgi:hypothetical protein
MREDDSDGRRWWKGNWAREQRDEIQYNRKLTREREWEKLVKGIADVLRVRA